MNYLVTNDEKKAIEVNVENGTFQSLWKLISSARLGLKLTILKQYSSQGKQK